MKLQIFVFIFSIGAFVQPSFASEAPLVPVIDLILNQDSTPASNPNDPDNDGVLSPQLPSIDGCSQGSPDYAFVDNAIYGCGGIWSNVGIENAQYLCAEGYSICGSADRMNQIGMTSQSCDMVQQDNEFFATKIGWDPAAFGICLDDADDGLYGCSSPNSDFGLTESQYMAQTGQSLTCKGSLTSTFSAEIFVNKIDENFDFSIGWDFGANNDFSGPSQINVTHTSTTGGVMCCADLPENTDNCPDDYNPDQLDSDNDGVGDACEVSLVE